MANGIYRREVLKGEERSEVHFGASPLFQDSSSLLLTHQRLDVGDFDGGFSH
jgi:hypothetical protein